MRVCFATLCFSSSRLNTCDEEAVVSNNNQTTIPQPVPATPPPPPSIRLNGTAKSAMASHQTVAAYGANMNVDELRTLLHQRDLKIDDLMKSLQQRENEILNLRSQLDKFQSVLVVSNPASPKYIGLNNNVGHRPRKQRAGISAEPQSEASILELSKQTFPTIFKDERWVFPWKRNETRPKRCWIFGYTRPKFTARSVDQVQGDSITGFAAFIVQNVDYGVSVAIFH